jgi:dTDP-4-dehydrorhamnose 3,5-epimerase
MELKIESRHLGDATVLITEIFQDQRGFFMETFRAGQFIALGLLREFVQDNHSGTVRGVLRGAAFPV